MLTVDAPKPALQDSELKVHLQRLRQVDGRRNLLAIARTWLFLAIVLGGAIGFDQWRIANGWPWLYDVPVFFVAILCVGAGQHQLTALGHEASHHVLLKNRYLNEWVSDWLCMFPVFTTTYHYRLHHLAHHQFVNDPERDPNFAQLQINGHWSKFPMTRAHFWQEVRENFLPWNLISYMLAIAKYNAMGNESNPYAKRGGPRSNWAKKYGIYYIFAFAAVTTTLAVRKDVTLLLTIPPLMFAGIITFLALIPDTCFHHHRLQAAVSVRMISITRLTFITLAFYAMAWICYWTGPRVYLYGGVLWVLPVVTSFAFFMMMRQVLQHSNGDRGWLTNSRILLVNRFIRDSILPYGQDYHLPHHLYASVPHYNLKELHEILMRYPEYRDQALVVANVVVPKAGHEHPTVVDMLGPQYAPSVRHEAHIDNTVLDHIKVDDREEILKVVQASVERENVP
jgi:fatty acid desaturase